MEGSSLADLWESRLKFDGWSSKAIKQSEAALATSTRKAYDNALNKYMIFSAEKGLEYPPRKSSELAEYICHLAESTTRPQSIVNTFLSALKQALRAKGLPDITGNDTISRLVTAVTKSQQRPMTKSTVLPVKTIIDSLRAWGDNNNLSTKHLRIKTISLLAIALMLRPSDVAPNATFFDKESLEEKKIIFSTDMLNFRDNGVEVTLFGTKNDLERKGFVVFLPGHSDRDVDPVQTLKFYLERTAQFRRHKAVFISLKAPFGPLSSSAVAKDLQECIDMCGLKGSGYTAKSFRPTGATVAIEKGSDPKMVQAVGRWKSTEVFYDHYVHCKTSKDFTDKLFS